MHGANQPDKGQVDFRPLEEAKSRRDRAFAGGRTLSVVQNKSLLRETLESFKFPLIMWLRYFIRSQRGG